MAPEGEPEPKGEFSTPEPKPGTWIFSTAYKIMSPEGEPEPEGEYSTPEPKPEKAPWGEPVPEWNIAKIKWGFAWEGHWIGMAVVFGILTIIAVLCLRRIFVKKRKRQVMAKFAITVTAIIAVFTTARFLYLIINPYESDYCMFGNAKHCPLFVNRLLFSIGLPSLLSAYLLLHLALRDVMKFKNVGKFTKLQKWWFLCGLVLLNYVFAITADMVVAYNTSTGIFLALCQGYFIVFSAVLVFAFAYSGFQMYRTDKKNKKEMFRLSRKNNSNVDNLSRKSGRNFIAKVLRLSFITSLLGFVLMALQIYALAFVYVEASAGKKPEPWAWLTYQYAYRFVEVAFAACILYNISYIPKRKSAPQGTVSNKSTNGHYRLSERNCDSLSKEVNTV